jgi:polysaccharide export outer membrane protein
VPSLSVRAASSFVAFVACGLLACAASAADTAGDYRIGAEDVLKVTVYGHPDLTQTVLVQADGSFTFPLVGRVKAEGVTVAGVEQDLTDKLGRRFIRDPHITVVVQEFRSQSVFVVGEVARPGTYALAGPTRLAEVLGKAGPLTAAAGPEVVIVRPFASNVGKPVLPTDVQDQAGGKPRAAIMHVSLREIESGDVDQNVQLQAGDTVFVPQATKVFVSGEVRNPGAYAWFPGMTARQLISVAGGVGPDGSEGRLRVVRSADGKKTRDLKIALDETVQPGDTLVVRRRMF